MPDEAIVLSGYGVVEGRVLECGLPVTATLSFRALADGRVETRAEAMTDTTGWYRAELPLGDYEVDLRTTVEELLYMDTYSHADTVRVGRAVRRRDFQRGRVRAEIRLPERLEGRNATLRLTRQEGYASGRAAVVDGVATFDLRLVPRLDFVMRLSPGDGGDQFLLPGTFLVAGADSVHVGGAPVDYAADVRGRYARVEGRVTGSWQDSGMSMFVSAMSAAGVTRNRVECAPDGSFALELIAPDFVRLKSSCGSVSRWFGGSTAGASPLHSLVPGQVIQGIDLREGGLRLRFEGPGHLADNVGTIELVHADGTRQSFDPGTTNPVLLPNLEAGEYRLRIPGCCERNPWRTQWYDRVVDEADALPLTVFEDAFTDATVRQEAGGALRGTFVGDDASVIAGFHVRVHEADGSLVCGEYDTYWTQGADFGWPGLADGDYLLSTLLYGQTWWYPGTFLQGEAGVLTIEGAGTVEGLIWRLPATGVVIR